MVHPTFNIGIEEEYQMIEPESRALLGYVSQINGQGPHGHPGAHARISAGAADGCRC